MNSFLGFARAHGIVIDAVPPVGVWTRYPTTDKPGSRNGAVKFMGNHGHVQNHATMTDVSTWRNEDESFVSVKDVQRIARQAAQETAEFNAQAAEKAQWILSQCEVERHAYLVSKGFDEEVVNVWQTPNGPVAVIPMWIGNEVCGCQLISEAGDKKFLHGQRSGGAQFVFANKGEHILCEGFATALSVRHALKNLKRKYTIHVCFSAGNMTKVASTLWGGMVVADNDPSGTGERVAREIGWPYWMSDVQGEDFNDAHQRMGLFAVGQSLMKVRRM
jgi:phage/plasmid primase-like uncharacterized protein